MAAKLVVASVLTVFFVLLFYGSNYLFAYCKYGFGDLDRPVQSVAGMYESPYMLTVGTFLVLYIVLKMAVCFVIVLIMIWFAQKMSTPSGAVLGIGIAGVVEYLLYLLLPSVSYMDAFKYINLVEYIQVYPLISKYHNLDFFEYPVNGMTLFKGVLPLVCILFLVLNLRKFAKCEKTLGKKAWNRKRERRYFIVTDKLFLHEAVKNLLTNRTIWLCAIVLYGAFMLGEGISAYKNIEESYYRYYIMEYAGHITEDTLEYFKAEKKKYDAIHSLTPENSGLSQQEISIKQDEIRDQYSGFMKAYEQVRDVLYNNQKIGKNQQELVYVTGYEELFGERAVNRNTRLIGILLCAVIAIYSASSVLGMEYDLKVMNLLRSTKKGREKLLFSKLETAFGVTFLMAVLIKIPMVLKIAKAYPLENWDAKVRSMMFAGQSVFDCTIWEYVFLLILAQMVSLFVIVLVVVVLSAILKDTILTCIFSIILFGGPLVLEWSGLRSIHYWSLNALLDAHSLFQYGWDMLILQVLIFWICIPLIAGYILYEIYERRK